MCTFKGERTVLVCDVAKGHVRQEIAAAVASGDVVGY